MDTMHPSLDSAARQRILDAMLGLQSHRRRALAALEADDAGEDTEVVATGDSRVLSIWMMRASHSWRHLLSTRPATTTVQLCRSLPNNSDRLGHGMTMTSVFDEAGTDPGARRLLTAAGGDYRFAYAPMQMRLVDQREVYLHGPSRGGSDSVLRLRSPDAVRAAWAYWYAVLSTATRCRGRTDGEPGLTPRQRTVLELLRYDLTDQRIAERLAVSVRTVRADIATAMTVLQVRSRFAAGHAYAERSAQRSD